MGVFDRMEKGIERAVNGAFAKAFRSEVQPVEIASALKREVDDRATIVSRGRTLVPNTFVVELGPADHGRLGEWQDALGDELREVVTEHAGQQQYAFVGPITVVFEEADDLDTGLFRVRSSTTKARTRREARQVFQPPVPGAAPVRAAAPHICLDIEGRSHQVTEPVTVIGRGTEADVIVDDAGVSRRHAEVTTDGDRLRVADLGSTNGTFVDGERVGEQGTLLADGSRITVGRTRVVVRYGSR